MIFIRVLLEKNQSSLWKTQLSLCPPISDTVSLISQWCSLYDTQKVSLLYDANNNNKNSLPSPTSKAEKLVKKSE